jgi:hypothetical protein
MTAKTFTILLTIKDEPGSMLFDTQALADIVVGALEQGQKHCVVKGIPNVRVQPVIAASADAFLGYRLDCKPGGVGDTAANGVGSIKRLHASLREDR